VKKLKGGKEKKSVTIEEELPIAKLCTVGVFLAECFGIDEILYINVTNLRHLPGYEFAENIYVDAPFISLVFYLLAVGFMGLFAFAIICDIWHCFYPTGRNLIPDEITLNSIWDSRRDIGTRERLRIGNHVWHLDIPRSI
jgi:hypothetical protein